MNARNSNAARVFWVAGSLHTEHLLREAGADALDSRSLTAERVSGRNVVIAPSATHKDPENVARAVGRQAHKLGAAKVAILIRGALPRDALDIADYLENANGQSVDLDTLAEHSEPLILDTRDGTTLQLVSIGTLLAEPPEVTRWLVEGLLPSGGLSVLAARPKVGKSTLARALAMSVSRGSPFLGRATAQGPVFLLDLEGKRGETVNALRGLGANEHDPIKFSFGPTPQNALDELRALAQAQRPVLIEVDTLQRLARVPDLNDYAKVSIALDPFIALARDTGAHVLLLHHQGRGERDGVDAPMGSTAIAGSVDTILTMKRRKDGTRTIASVQRYGVDMEETIITLDANGRLETNGLAHEHEQREAAGRVLDYLREHPDAEQADIKEGVEGRWAGVRAALTGMVKAETVTRTGTGRKGDPFKYSVSSSRGSQEPAEPENQNSSNNEAETF